MAFLCQTRVFDEFEGLKMRRVLAAVVMCMMCSYLHDNNAVGDIPSIRVPVWVSRLPKEETNIYGVGCAGPQVSWQRQKILSELLAKRDIAAQMKVQITSNLQSSRISKRASTGNEVVADYEMLSTHEYVDQVLYQVEVVDQFHDRQRNLFYTLVRVPWPLPQGVGRK
jgi:hypothetical protein